MTAAEITHTVWLPDCPCGLLLTQASQKTLTEVNAAVQGEITILQEQKQGLQSALDIIDTAYKKQDAAFKQQDAILSALKKEHTDSLARHESSFAERLAVEKARIKELTDDLGEARSRFATAEDRNKILEDEVRGLRSHNQMTQTPSSPSIESAVHSLKSQIASLEASELKSTLRAKTIEARYRTGDLVRSSYPIGVGSYTHYPNRTMKRKPSSRV